MSDSSRQHSSLPGTGAGDDPNRFGRRFDGGALLVVQLQRWNALHLLLFYYWWFLFHGVQDRMPLVPRFLLMARLAESL